MTFFTLTKSNKHTYCSEMDMSKNLIMSEN